MGGYPLYKLEEDLQIISQQLLQVYRDQVPVNLEESFQALHEADISTNDFSFYTSVASVFSSKIEGEDIELDSYVKHKRFGIEFLPDYTKKTDDLYNAYTFAKTHTLNESNIAEAHKLLSRHIVAANLQGKIRKQNMYVTTSDGKIEYVAALPQQVGEEMEKLYRDIDVLVRTKMNDIREVFFYAAMIHLVFIKIHPWNDGNGRCARLIEKWFLGEKLGEKAWFIQSEKYYYMQHANYYSNIRMLGLEYPELDYSKAIPFLLMLPNSL